MTTKRSPIYTVLAVLFGVIMIAGGLAKAFRGFSQLTATDSTPAVRDLLVKSDAAAEEANRKSEAVSTAFDELLAEFDKLGVAKFRAEKSDACANVSEQFNAVTKELDLASNALKDASKLESNEKLKNFILTKSKSYDLLVEANKKNVDIVAATMDESLPDVNAVLAKIESLAASRATIQKESLDASTAADELIKQK